MLEKFGLELRKIGNVNSLYKEVNMVLDSHKMESKGISSETQIQTTAHALHKMFQSSGHFSVCTIRTCAELSNICISRERMNVYESIHCMSWSNMLPEYAQMIIAMVLDDFRTVLDHQNVSVK